MLHFLILFYKIKNNYNPKKNIYVKHVINVVIIAINQMPVAIIGIFINNVLRNFKPNAPFVLPHTANPA